MASGNVFEPGANPETFITVASVVFAALAFNLPPNNLPSQWTTAHTPIKRLKKGSACAPTGFIRLLFEALERETPFKPAGSFTCCNSLKNVILVKSRT